MPTSITVNIKGGKSVTVKSGGTERQWCTAVLCTVVNDTNCHHIMP
jgi:hypothetical protein